MEGNSNPIHQHYVPVFILKNFAKNGGRFFYYDFKKKVYYSEPPKNVFADNDFYTLDNDYDNAYEIENSLSIFESDVAPIIDEIINNNEVSIKRGELESLKIFLSLLSFRSALRKNQYLDDEFDGKTSEVLNAFGFDDSRISLWKKEMLVLSKFRSIKDIKESDKIDLAVKNEFLDDYGKYYMTIVKAYGQDFLLSDVCPTLEMIVDENNNPIVFHQIYPVSTNTAIILNFKIFNKSFSSSNQSLQRELVECSRIKDNAVLAPRVKYSVYHDLPNREDVFTYKKTKLYERDLVYINCLILNEVRNGFIFNDKKKLLDVLTKYKNEDGQKNNYDDLEAVLLENT